MQEVPSLRGCLKRMAGSVLGRWRSLFVLQFYLKLASVSIFSSAIGALLSWLLSFEGSPAIGNTALIGFAVSPIGMASLLLIPAAYLGILYFEQACILYVAADPSGRVIGSGQRALAKLPKIMQLATIQIAIMLAVTAPFLLIAGATYRLLLTDADINYYLTHWPPKFWLAIGIGVSLVVTASIIHLLFVFRWFLALPWLLVGKANAVDALRYSAHARSARPIVWRCMLIWIVIRMLCSLVGLVSIGLLTYIVLDSVDHHRTTSVLMTTGLLIVHTVITASLTSIDQCWHVAGKWQAYRWTGAPTDNGEEGQDSVAKVAVPRKRVIAFGLVFLVTVFLLGLAAFQQTLSLTDQHDVQIVAHRAGPNHAPENSLSALRLAIQAGADAAEIDVQLSRDGTIFVVHDRDLMRLASLPIEVSKATDAQLQAAAIAWKPPSTSPPERLATLEEFLEAARDKIHLSIELKYYGWNERLAIKVIELLRATDMLDQCEIISLDYRALEQVRLLEPKISRGFLVSTSLGDITKLDVQLLSVSQSMFT
ncbi:MAG: glycerophosphoryl diester phosphodiesterase membrane domain-containing protein, partial [Pirellulaceae bacterium]|nr:glycerophosphoryl diester phosphodiesterase membrane domain-containing protein [Pirellulaceae bacterium]